MNKRKQHFWKSILTNKFTIVVLLVLVSGEWALAQNSSWTKPRVISVSPNLSWFPDMAIDEFGNPHVIWCQTDPYDKRLQEQVIYTHWSAGEWSEPNDIVAPSPDIVRNAIAADMAGSVHLLFGGSVYGGTFNLYHQKAPLNDAWSAAAWSPPHRINQGDGYMGDIAVDSQGTLHVIYDDIVGQPSGDNTHSWSDIFYRHSTDGGQIWSRPVDLSLSPLTGSSRPYLEIDRNDILHVTWDEGWDRLSGEGQQAYGGYVSSPDGGQSWTPTTVITYPETTVAQLTVGSDDRGGVLLVWRATSRPGLFYQWSTDGGHSWQKAAEIPQILARPWDTPFDMYDMATDSAGRIHLLVVGRQSPERDAPLGVYHLVWDGGQWAPPVQIFKANRWYPEYPKILVHEGNQLHAVWFARYNDIWDAAANRQVWYSHKQVDAPRQAVTPLPTPTPPPPITTPTPALTAAPQATYSKHIETDPPSGLYTDYDDVLQLIKALFPLALVILIVALIKTRGFGRLRR